MRQTSRSTTRYSPAILTAIGCALGAIWPIGFLAGTPARSAVPHPTAQPAATIVPSDPKNGYPAFSIQLGQNWARSKPRSIEGQLGDMPSFARQDSKIGKQTAFLSVMPTPNPPASLVSQCMSLIHFKQKDGKPLWKVEHWGQFTAGLLYMPNREGAIYDSTLTAYLVSSKLIVYMIAKYPAPAMATRADGSEFIAMAKSFKLVNAK